MMIMLIYYLLEHRVMEQAVVLVCDDLLKEQMETDLNKFTKIRHQVQVHSSDTGASLKAFEKVDPKKIRFFIDEADQFVEENLLVLQNDTPFYSGLSRFKKFGMYLFSATMSTDYMVCLQDAFKKPGFRHSEYKTTIAF